MGFKTKRADEIQKILSFGGSIKIDGTHRTTEELCQIAAYAIKSKLIITGMKIRSVDDIAKIAAYSVGNVQFEDEP